MTDAEITKRCAEAMGLDDRKLAILESGFSGRRYDPLHEDADAFALLKKYPGWCLGAMTIELEREPDKRDFNRAICECVANMVRP